jgi:hypothetical protein
LFGLPRLLLVLAGIPDFAAEGFNFVAEGFARLLCRRFDTDVIIRPLLPLRILRAVHSKPQWRMRS